MADCIICGDPCYGYGNNPAPLRDEGSCCDECNMEYVIPARLKLYLEHLLSLFGLTIAASVC
jgi:hypothetical protein